MSIVLMTGLTSPTTAQTVTPTLITPTERALAKQIELKTERLEDLRAIKRARTSDEGTRSGRVPVQARNADLLSLDATTVDADIAIHERELAALHLAAQQSKSPAEGARLLTQAAVEAGAGAPKVSLDSVNLYFRNGATRFYVRSTLSTEAGTDGNGDGTAAEAAEVPGLDKRLQSALSDPFGGLLYVAVGELIGRNPTKDEGVFLDLRAGAKFVQLSDDAASNGGATAALMTASGGLRIIERLFDTDKPGASDVGQVEFSAIWSVSRALDRGVSPLFAADGALGRWPKSLNVAVGLKLNDSVALTARGIPWASHELSKDFTIGISLLK